MLSSNYFLRFAILFPLGHKVEPRADMLRLPDRLATNSIERPSRFDQCSLSQRCRIRPILAANG